MFNVTVYVNVTGEDIFNYQINMTYDPTQLTMLRAGYTHGAESDFFYPMTAVSPGPSFGPSSVLIGEAILAPDVQTGYGSVIWAEFNITATPPPGGTFTSLINITNPDTWVQGPAYTLYPISTFNAPYTFEYRLPAPLFGYSPKLPLINQTITFNGSASYDPVGTIVAWAWTFGDGGTASGIAVTHEYTSPGTYQVDLTVTDNGALSSCTIKQITVYQSGTGGTGPGYYGPAIEDVAIVRVVPSRSVTFPGVPVNVAVTAKNLGTVTESFDVIAYYNVSLIGMQHVVNLNPLQQISMVFTWNTTGLTPTTNYVIMGVDSIVPVGINTTNNVLLGGEVHVSIVGDVGGYGKVDMRDIGIVAAAFGSYGPNYLYPGSPPSPRWNPNADITGLKYMVPDGKVDMLDVALVARNFGQHYP
jgi:PKD repeat protein